MLAYEKKKWVTCKYGGSQKITARELKIQRTYLCRIKGELDKKEKGLNVKGGESDGRQDSD